MTPRDHRLAQAPSFVEFDMSIEGFACLLIPSLAPLSSDRSGVGNGERVFPPLSGLSITMWLNVDQFSDKRLDPHPIRLLSVFRCFSGFRKKNERDPTEASQLTCLSVQLSCIDHSLLISTLESETAGNDLEKEEQLSDENFVRVALADTVVTHQWTHIAVVLTRAVLKHSQVSVYINGVLRCSQKLHYIVQNVGGAATHLAQTSGIHGIIGTPPMYRSPSRLLFKIASFYVLEEALSPEAVNAVYRLEPHYVGNFQMAGMDGAALIPEERVCISLSAAAVMELTVARICSMYSQADGSLIASYLGLSAHDRSTPLRVLSNTIAHAPGPARAFGAVVIGYLGMRVFAPRPVTRILESVGGVSCLLGLVAMAADSQGLYASLKALVSAIRSDRNIANRMYTTRSYQTLAVLLEEKSCLLNSHILHLILSLVGTLDTSRETTTIPSLQTFEDLLCDLDVWKSSSEDLNRLLYEHFYELITDQQRSNLSILRRSSLPCRVLIRLLDMPENIHAVNDVVFNLLGAIVQPPCDANSLLKIGQMVAATLPISVNEHSVNGFPLSVLDLQAYVLSSRLITDTDRAIYMVYIRNRILNIIANSLAHSTPNNNVQMCEQIAKVLGFDWVLTFFSPNLHVGTIDVAFRILLFLLNHPHLLQRFREGSTNGGWLTDADSVVRNRAAVLLGFSVSAHGGSVGAQIDINPEMSNCGGFTALEHLLSSHAEKPQCYMAMLSVLFGQPVPNIKLGTDFSLDLVWSNIFGLSLSSSVTEAISTATICPDALIPLLSMVRATLHDGKETDPDDNWRQRYPCTVIQILSFLYQNSSELFSICHTEEFIVLLFTVLIPFEITSVNTNIEKSTQSTDSTLVIERVLRNPCGRSILDLIKRILCDDVYLSHDARTDNTLDTLIENIPDNGVSRRFQSIVLSEIIVVCMDNMIATDILLEGSLTSMLLLTNPSPPASSTNTNFVYFASRIVDCLWMGVYTKEPTTVLDFLFKAVLLGRRKESRASITESLMPSLSRTILYLLSRPIDSPKVQSSILDTLSGILNNRSIVFAPSFNDPVFFGAFTHLIFMLSITPDIFPEDGHSCQLDRSSAQVALCAAEVWRELCNFKRHTLEEVFKRVFVNELNAARALLSNVASLHWQTFVDSQITCSSTRNIAQIQQQIQQRITKVASGFQRLASRKGLSSSSSSPSISMWRQTDISAEVVQMWVRVHTSLIRELMRIQCTRYHEWHAHVRKWCLAEWHVLESELTRERGLWGPEEGSVLDKFCLDTTESPCRIRRKLIPNPAFYHQYPYRPHLDHPEYKALRTKFAVSRDSKIYYEVMKKRRSKTMDSRIVDNSTSMESPSDDRAELLFTDLQEVNASMIRRVSVKNANDAKEKLAVKNSSEPSQEKAELDDDEDGVDTNGEEGEDANSTAEPNLGLSVPGREGADVTIGDRSEAVATGAKEQKEKKGPDNQTLLRLLEQGEQLQSMFRCARIQGLDTSEGLLLFGRDHYYVVDGFTLLKTREIRDLDFLPQQLHDPIVPYMACGVARPTRCLRLCSKFSYEDIREVHKRRYLLQPIAIEVFSADGRNYLLAFPKKMRNRVYQKLISMAKGLMDSGSESVSGQRASMSIEQNSRVSLLSSLIGQQSVTQRWVNGEISNFQYLMHLNTIAGRSYNDLSQYPVFPWVLRDYESESLDLTNPSAFRDLSRPMGAQDPERLQQFLKRYKEWDDPTGETPPYMYGTHYSSAMIVVSYLVRLEPFTQQFLKLQGGHFDLADRMFHSVRDAWLSASRKNMADVKELIPEFYSLPEMFINANHFDFGVKQNGVVLDDVVLPPWAKGDAREFVRIHRETTPPIPTGTKLVMTGSVQI
ncbi:hypothetical protein AB6A40_004354 [Gnathostoma spinigerum]|uniref:WD repeat and FYVE domain-containing protein 3 n=1 Tax=Gnathostoma spinigerum TaxID=75299 RepID=A0ABD6EC91_9BILA